GYAPEQLGDRLVDGAGDQESHYPGLWRRCRGGSGVFGRYDRAIGREDRSGKAIALLCDRSFTPQPSECLTSGLMGYPRTGFCAKLAIDIGTPSAKPLAVRRATSSMKRAIASTPPLRGCVGGRQIRSRASMKATASRG